MRLRASTTIAGSICIASCTGARQTDGCVALRKGKERAGPKHDTRSKYIDGRHTHKSGGRASSSQPAPRREVGGEGSADSAEGSSPISGTHKSRDGGCRRPDRRPAATRTALMRLRCAELLCWGSTPHRRAAAQADFHGRMRGRQSLRGRGRLGVLLIPADSDFFSHPAGHVLLASWWRRLLLFVATRGFWRGATGTRLGLKKSKSIL